MLACELNLCPSGALETIDEVLAFGIIKVDTLLKLIELHGPE